MAAPAWRLWIDPVPRPGWWQMAVDAALLERAALGAPPVIRFYAWEPRCLSFGRHEPARARYDPAHLARRGLDAVRRPTGGRAVLHHRELTYAVAGQAGLLGGPRGCYDRLHAAIAAALEALGAPTTRAAAPVSPVGVDAGPCFRVAAGGEVLVGARKVAGSAQARVRGALLQHGSVRVPFATLAGPLAEALRPLAARWQDVDDDAEARALAEGHAARFRDTAWTWWR
ncbi:MAG: hypothetical protein NW201_09515 [Gemmatimonadales bacterium]|nr:hypothetical protein [Gemmatimonadales bacterium]